MLYITLYNKKQRETTKDIYLYSKHDIPILQIL